MEGKPSLTIEGTPLLIRNTFKETPYIPYYRRKSPPRDLQTNSIWKSFTI